MIKKFRLCHTAQNGERTMKYYSDGDRFLIGLDGSVYENYGVDWKHPVWEKPFDVADRPILQQFTGCIDKNGKEVYEGDIIRIGDDGTANFIVKYKNGSFTTKYYRHTWYKDCKIIGNIFENSDILVS